METIFYGEEEQRAAKRFVEDVERVTRVSAFGERLSAASTIRDEVAEAARFADDLLCRLAGPRPEADCGESCKEANSGGALGELSFVQYSTINYLADLRRALEQIGKLV